MTGQGAESKWVSAPFVPHTIYKSYDTAWLAAGDFARMTQWLQILTTVDLGDPKDAAQCITIDSWLDWLEAEKGLDVTHSTGTMGRLSFVPRAKTEAEASFPLGMQGFAEWWAEIGTKFHVVWVGTSGGRSGLQKAAARWRKFGTPSPDAYASLFEYDLGADYEFYVAQARKARAGGELRLPQPTTYVEERLIEAERRQADRPQYFNQLLDTLDSSMRGKRTLVLGGIRAVAELADAGLKRGLEGIFEQGSVLYTAGGLKGRDPVPQYAATLRRFMGTDRFYDAYGMSEMNSGLLSCQESRFHAPEWLDVRVLDPANGWKLLPRTGTQEGRGAFFDHSVTSCPGGLVSSDHIVVSYDPCKCGRTTPHVSPDIKRLQDADDDYSFVPTPRDGLEALLKVAR